jgi:hypothetical protein
MLRIGSANIAFARLLSPSITNSGAVRLASVRMLLEPGRSLELPE